MSLLIEKRGNPSLRRILMRSHSVLGITLLKVAGLLLPVLNSLLLLPRKPLLLLYSETHLYSVTQ